MMKQANSVSVRMFFTRYGFLASVVDDGDREWAIGKNGTCVQNPKQHAWADGGARFWDEPAVNGCSDDLAEHHAC